MKTIVKLKKGLDEICEAADIRRQVFVEEQGFVNEFDDTDKTAVHAVVYCDGAPAATGRIYMGNGAWTLGRIAVLPEFRGKGLGAEVVLALHDYARKNGGGEIIISAQDHAVRFYEKLGYKNLGNPHMDEHCLHYTMAIKL